jgi:hypothetical protein
MTKTFCDRCGDDVMRVGLHSGKVEVTIDGSRQTDIPACDLCSSCIQELKRFFQRLPELRQ